MIPALIAAFVMTQAPVCSPPVGTELLWAKPETRFGFIGETHGTNEVPAAFAEMVCGVSATRPIVVALELPEAMQPDLDIWMASDGGEAARARLLNHDYWIVDHADGRSSHAVFAMLERLRALKFAGRDLTLRAWQPNTVRPPGFDQSYWEIGMADRLVQAAYSRPDAYVLVLGGSNHARKTIPERYGFLFAAGHLKATTIVSVRVALQGGRTWACFGNAPCGDSDLGPAEFDSARRGVVLEPQEEGAFDGLLALGPSTASAPARVIAAP